jgi:pyruvate-formate lyase-activating enzyme
VNAVAERHFIKGFYHYREDLYGGVRTAVVFDCCRGDCEFACAPFPFPTEHPFAEDMPETYLYSAGEMAEYLQREQVLFGNRPIGITFMGKEPLRLISFCYDLGSAVHQKGMDLHIWTCGTCSSLAYDILRPFTDLYIFQLFSPWKRKDEFFSSFPYERVMENLFTLDEKQHPYRIRIPVIRGINERSPEEFLPLLAKLKNRKSVILDFSRSGLKENEIFSYRNVFLNQNIVLY